MIITSISNNSSISIISSSSNSSHTNGRSSQSNAITSTTSISFIVVLIFCLAERQLCTAAGVLSDDPAQHYQNNQQHQQQQQQTIDTLKPHSSGPSDSTSGGDLVGRLLRLSKSTDVLSTTTGDNDNEQLKSMLSAKANEKWQLAKRAQHEKAALKKKWHKIVDDLVDSSSFNLPSASSSSTNNDEKFLVDKPQARKRLSSKLNQFPVPSSADSANDDANEDKLTMFIVKRKLSNESDGASLQQSEPISSNGLGDLLAASSSGQASPSQSQQRINMAEHSRRILGDDFGILRHSIFSTNNQLGTKEVPKFGSDEQF